MIDYHIDDQILFDNDSLKMLLIQRKKLDQSVT